MTYLRNRRSSRRRKRTRKTFYLGQQGKKSCLLGGEGHESIQQRGASGVGRSPGFVLVALQQGALRGCDALSAHLTSAKKGGSGARELEVSGGPGVLEVSAARALTLPLLPFL